MKIIDLLAIMDSETFIICKSTEGHECAFLAKYENENAYSQLCEYLKHNLYVTRMDKNYCYFDAKGLISEHPKLKGVLEKHPEYEDIESMLFTAINYKMLELCEEILNVFLAQRFFEVTYDVCGTASIQVSASDYEEAFRIADEEIKKADFGIVSELELSAADIMELF